MDTIRTLGGIAAALLAAIFLAVTNPGPADFHQYLQTQVKQQMEESRPSGPFADVMNRFASWMVTEQGKQKTIRNDYVIFSTYTVELDGEEYRWLGVVKQFLPLRR